MFGFDVTTALYKIKSAVTLLLPVAKAIGGDMLEKVATLAKTGIEVAENVKKQVDAGVTIVHADEKKELDELINDLSKVNDELAEYIASH